MSKKIIELQNIKITYDENSSKKNLKLLEQAIKKYQRELPEEKEAFAFITKEHSQIRRSKKSK